MAFGLPSLDSVLASLSGRIGGRLGLPSNLPEEPMTLLAGWFDDAIAAKASGAANALPNPDAMTLATATADGVPSARIVLCKSIDPVAGSLVFYTHRTGRKGRELAENPRAACVFHWDYAGRQARIDGVVSLLDDAASDAYFARRPLISRLGAWASRQSEPLASRLALVEAVRDAARRLGVSATDFLDPTSAPSIPRPPHWGGFVLRATTVELWLGGDGRLHDRARWTRTTGPAGEAGPWSSTRLFP